SNVHIAVSWSAVESLCAWRMEVENRGIHFLETHRAELIQSVSDVMPIADKMMSRKLIHKEAYEKIRAARTSQEKMRDVYDALRPGGDEVKAELYRILREECPLIIQKLSSPSSCSAREVDTARKKYINHIKSDCAVVKEYNSLIGERVWLDDRYMDLLLIQQHRKENERTEELRSKGNTLQQVLSKRDSKDFRNTRIECLFDSVPHGVTNLEPVIPQILSQPEKVLFIVDGFDELKLSEEALKDFTTDPYEKILTMWNGKDLIPTVTLQHMVTELKLTRCMGTEKLVSAKCCNLVTFRLFDCCSLSDEGLQGLLSPLRLMAFLKEVEIPVSCLTAPLALGFVSFLQSCDHLKL
ncbi:hypothetical protein Z043_114846, partial [Scleropages formosus]